MGMNHNKHYLFFIVGETLIAIHLSSLIQTLLSVLELHQINLINRLADFTAGRELHPALKTSLFNFNFHKYYNVLHLFFQVLFYKIIFDYF